MKFISYEIRQMCIDPLGADPLCNQDNQGVDR